MHVVEALVDLLEGAVVGDELVDPELALHVVLNKTGELSAALDAAERRSLPDTASDELEGAGRDLGTGLSDTDNVAHAPALVAALEGLAHDVDVARSVKRKVETAVGHLDQVVDNVLALEVGRVDKVGRAKLLGPLLLLGVDVDRNDLGAVLGARALDNRETDTADTEDGDGGALWMVSATVAIFQALSQLHLVHARCNCAFTHQCRGS